jgi:hypothetical protein
MQITSNGSTFHCRIDGDSGPWVTCGRRHGKSFFDVVAALVGCGHVSGLLMRQVWPLALMLCADQGPIVSTHFSVR